ncbi:MAG: glycosyltransferase, partial [Terrimicrobiaceae bacterium]
MRIAFAMINCNRRDGSARAVNEVAEILARRGHDVHLYARKVEDLDLQAVRWHRVPGPGWPEVADFASYHFAVNRLLAHHDYDIV